MEWIKCEDRMPSLHQKVIAYDGRLVSQCVYTENRYAKSERGRGARFEKYSGIWRGVSHWMPMPEAPTT
ncbi:DUF551 domain-containing protein [Citrobacter freundii]|uniref:DUF551 domain-containing protein n=1 Tax=Citrobacter freundii TaxID=546 RepID=UPI003CC57245